LGFGASKVVDAKDLSLKAAKPNIIIKLFISDGLVQSLPDRAS
jgi:hypothetical protein